LLFVLNQIYSLGLIPDLDLYEYISKEELREQGHNICDINRFSKINYIILFDEIDIGFHPDWQKRTIKYIIDFLNALDDNKYYHLIFATHSAFLLSDLPKQNIIFLETYKGGELEVLSGKQKIGNCKVVDGLKEKKQTFGANIHTLLSDSFFMEDGLMGEFAKGKIEDVISFLNEKESRIKNYEEANKIIEIIGEPILKMKLQKMLENYKNNNSIESKEEIINQIVKLQEKLRKIDNNG